MEDRIVCMFVLQGDFSPKEAAQVQDAMESIKHLMDKDAEEEMMEELADLGISVFQDIPEEYCLSDKEWMRLRNRCL